MLPFPIHRLRLFLFAALILLGAGGRLSAQLVTGFSANGLTSLRYNGFEFITDPFVQPSVILQNAGGTRYEVGPTQRAFDPVLKRLNVTYPWGSVTVSYVTTGSRLTMEVNATNNSADTIVEFAVGLMRVRFPGVPAGSGWANGNEMAGLNIDDLTAIPADYGTGVLVTCNDTPGAPLKFGFTSPDGQQTRVVRMTTLVTDCPDDPRIAPQSSAQFRFSLRFAPAGTDPESLIPDLHAALRAQAPPVLAWNDRRAIGTVFLASGFHSSATNPRGWLNEPNLNTLTPAGIANFRQQMLARADDTVARLLTMNAQGMIFWNVEGEQYPYITYAGDPRVIASLAPEMDGIADEFFAKFTTAGLRTGVCLRPSRIVPGFVGSGHVWDHDNFGFDILANLSNKITYAQNRWGCTLFYLDTNVDWTFDNHGTFVGRLLRSSIYTALHALHPDVLVIPEIPRTADWAGAAPYREVNGGGFTSTRARSKAVYPEALTIIEPKDTDWAANYTLLVDAVRSGDILLFRSWFPDSGNPFVKAIYDEAHSELTQWREQYFPGQGGTGSATDSANGDGDAFINLFEFAFGLNPTVADPPDKQPQVHPVTDAGTQWLGITFRRRTATPPGLSYIVEESTTLTGWTRVNAATHQVGLPVDQGDGTELVTIRTTHPLGSGQSFLRLRVRVP